MKIGSIKKRRRIECEWIEKKRNEEVDHDLRCFLKPFYKEIENKKFFCQIESRTYWMETYILWPL